MQKCGNSQFCSRGETVKLFGMPALVQLRSFRLNFVAKTYFTSGEKKARHIYIFKGKNS